MISSYHYCDIKRKRPKENAAHVDLYAAFFSSISAMDSHKRMEALYDFLLDQMDAVKNRTLAVPPAEWPDPDAPIALLLKYVARFRTDNAELLAIIPLINTDLKAAHSAE